MERPLAHPANRQVQKKSERGDEARGMFSVFAEALLLRKIFNQNRILQMNGNG